MNALRIVHFVPSLVGQFVRVEPIAVVWEAARRGALISAEDGLVFVLELFEEALPADGEVLNALRDDHDVADHYAFEA